MSEVASNLPATVGFSVGNTELTNLIVQDQVAKVQTRITDIKARIGEIHEALIAEEDALRTRVQNLGVVQWADKLKQLCLHLYEFGVFPQLDRGDTPSETYDGFKLIFSYGEEVIHQTRRLRTSLWTQEEIDNPPESLRLEFRIERNFTKNGTSWSSYLHLPIQNMELLPITLDEECRNLISSARRRSLELSALVVERDRLIELIADTGNIEKKVLAALTRKTLDLNPELMVQIGQVVATIENGLPMIEAK